MIENKFNKETYEDVYKTIGVIIELSQDLERYYRQCAEYLDFDIDKLETREINRINGVLYSYNKISEIEFGNLQSLGKEYYYLIHEFFWDSALNRDLKLMTCRLKEIYDCICKSCDTLEKVLTEFNKSYNYFI